MASFTSQGPVEDGRLKPAVAAQGEATVSAASGASLGTYNCSTCSLDGSSMSAPTAAGLAALVREYYAAGYCAAGTRSPAQGLTPTGSLIKATLLDGAVPLGIQAPGPNFDSGYGRIQPDRTLAFAEGTPRLRGLATTYADWTATWQIGSAVTADFTATWDITGTVGA